MPAPLSVGEDDHNAQGRRHPRSMTDDASTGVAAYFAYATALVSRITVTLIWPGYCIWFSIF
jgi:hypothetical protein